MSRTGRRDKNNPLAAGIDLEQPLIVKTDRARLSFFYAIPIGVLGGLVGLGGAEFRLPVLAGPLNYTARQAVPLNLVVSLVSNITAPRIRGRTLSF